MLENMAASVLSILTILCFFIGNLAISNGYLYTHLCRPSSTLIRGVFIATFGLSASLLQLCLWEIHGSLQDEAWGLAWKVVVRMLLVDLIVVIPLLSCYILFGGYVPKASRSVRAMIPTVPFLLFLYLFYQLGSILPLPHGSALSEKFHLLWRVPSQSLTEECVWRIGAMGVTLMAILSGFGSICAGWEMYLAPVRPVSEADVTRAKTSVDMTQDLIDVKRRKISQLEERIYEKSQEGTSFVNRIVNSVRGNNDHQELSVLQAEVKGLSQMHSSLQSRFSLLHSIHSRQAHQKTPLGLLILLTRHFFALYCIYRVLSTAWSNFRLFILGRPTVSSDDDPIPRMLAILATPWSTAPLDIDAYRHLIGFVLVGIVIAVNINVVISTIQRLSKSTPLSPAVSTLCISWVSGTYFVSTAVMLRSHLPEKYIGGIGNALGSLQRGTFEMWFDIVFFVVAVVTSVGLFLVRSWNYDDNIELEGKEV